MLKPLGNMSRRELLKVLGVGVGATATFGPEAAWARKVRA